MIQTMFTNMYICIYACERIVSVMLCAHRNAHSSVVGVVNEIIIIIIIK